MTKIGAPVPPGFTYHVPTHAGPIRPAGAFPEGMLDEAMTALADVERTPVRNSATRKIRCWYRCAPGTKFSMPGMMDTCSTWGLKPEAQAGLARLSGDATLRRRRLSPLRPALRAHCDGRGGTPLRRVMDAYKARGEGDDEDQDLPKLSSAEWSTVQGDRPERIWQGISPTTLSTSS